MESAASQIRHAMTEVQALRARVTKSPELAAALHDIKIIQSRRFAVTYQDLLQSDSFKECTEFFLTELYSERDYCQRDQQFAKVAGAIELAFPESVIQMTVYLAKLHQVTETLDVEMAKKWIENSGHPHATRYLIAWEKLDCTRQREWQLSTVLLIGHKLGVLTRQSGLRMLLKMMRKPASVAGLSELQVFLEKGFDKFKQMSKQEEKLRIFLETIQSRESQWINTLNSNDKTVSLKLLSKAGL